MADSTGYMIDFDIYAGKEENDVKTLKSAMTNKTTTRRTDYYIFKTKSPIVCVMERQALRNCCRQLIRDTQKVMSWVL